MTNQEIIAKKALLHAYLAADGCINIRREKSRPTTHHDIRFSSDSVELIELFRSVFEAVYHQKPYVEKTAMKNQGCYSTRIGSKSVAFDILSVAPVSSLEWRIPFDFLTTFESKTNWVKAFFDCESHVNTTKNIRLQVQSVNYDGLADVKCLLNELGIETTRIYKYERKEKNWNTNYILEIGRISEVQKYASIIGFNHPFKKAKLEAAVAESG